MPHAITPHGIGTPISDAHPDVLVVGGGVIGASVSYALAAAGLSVTLLERDDLAAHASGAAAGMLAPICESSGEGPFFDFALKSLESFPELVGRLRELGGVDPQYVPSGVLRVALTTTEAADLRSRAARLSRFGIEWLGPDEARTREPLLNPELRGALWSPRESHVYSPLMARAYAQAAARLGARIRTGVPVTGLRRHGDRVIGVDTPEGAQEAAFTVLCAGVWTRFCADWIPLPLPIEPVRGQILALASPRPAFRSILWSEGVYLVPKLNGSVVVGATEERVGFDCRTTAAGVAQLLTAATELVPALSDAAFLQAWSGLRPDTPDHFPVIGAISGVDGLILAAGHYRNGVLLSPITGQTVADWILRGEVAEIARPFLPERLFSRAPSGLSADSRGGCGSGSGRDSAYSSNVSSASGGFAQDAGRT